jgi:Type IV secretion system pilin
MTDEFHSFLRKVEVALINPIITLLGIAAFTLFVFGIVEFVGGAGNEEKRSIGQRHMIWGFIGLTIMFGAKAIIAIMASSIGVPVP